MARGTSRTGSVGLPAATQTVSRSTLQTGSDGAAQQSLGPLPADAILLQQYRELTRPHFGPLTGRLFRELTGLSFQITWAPTWPQQWAVNTLPTGSALCRGFITSSALPLRRCQACAAHHLPLALGSGPAGHRFTCPRGVRNFWLPIRVRNLTVGIAFVQTRHGPPGWCGKRFERAAHLLRLVVHYAQTADLAELRKADRTQARVVAEEHVQEEARLRRELSRVLPAVHQTPASATCETRAEQLVHQILDRIHKHYAEPLTLRQCAENVGLNPSYLSTLFSQRVGLPFRTYLAEVRLEKARQLLGDHALQIREVATAVGYSNGNRFRLAFKAATGLPPSAWRAVLRP